MVYAFDGKLLLALFRSNTVFGRTDWVVSIGSAYLRTVGGFLSYIEL